MLLIARQERERGRVHCPIQVQGLCLAIGPNVAKCYKQTIISNAAGHTLYLFTMISKSLRVYTDEGGSIEQVMIPGNIQRKEDTVSAPGHMQGDVHFYV